jgi:hypothetical protein
MKSSMRRFFSSILIRTARLHARKLRVGGCALLAVALVLFPGVALADKVFIELASGPGISDDDLSSFYELIRTSVGQLGHESVGDPKQADVVLRPKLLRLGGAYIATLDRVEHGKVTRSDQLKAAHIEELDQVASRLTRAVMIGENAKGDVRVGEVTDQEVHEGKNRKEAIKGHYFGFGPASLGNLNATGIAYSFTGAYSWDVNTALVRIGIDSTFGDDAFMGDVHLGVDFPLTDRDVAPYLGVKAGLGLSKANGGLFDGATAGGFVVGVEGGILLLRTSSINLCLGGDWAILLNSNGIGKPVMAGAHLGLYF